MKLLAIDPGPRESGWVVYDTTAHKLIALGIDDNILIEETLMPGTAMEHLVIEMVASYGMVVGQSVFDTVFAIGFLCATFLGHHPGEHSYTRVYRKQSWYGPDEKNHDSVAMHLCKNNRAKDKNIRQALIDKFPSTGGGKCPQIGTKNQPGLLYGVKGHMWAALAVALTWAEQVKGARQC